MEGIIEILIAVLFIALPAVFKAIGNRLEKSGADKSGQFKKLAETFIEENEEEEQEEEQMVEPVKVVKPVEPVPASVMKRAPKKPTILVEDEPKKKGEKIDPTKLGIYSEIMKPKF